MAAVKPNAASLKGLSSAVPVWYNMLQVYTRGVRNAQTDDLRKPASDRLLRLPSTMKKVKAELRSITIRVPKARIYTCCEQTL